MTKNIFLKLPGVCIHLQVTLKVKLKKYDKIYPSLEQNKKHFKNFIGDYYQAPHNFSSKKVNGKKAYEFARKKIHIDLKKKKKNHRS